MSINYALFPNKLTEEAGLYAAKVQITESLDLNQIADRIVDSGTTVRKPDVLAVLENLVKVCETALLDGCRVNLGGVFDLFSAH